MVHLSFSNGELLLPIFFAYVFVGFKSYLSIFITVRPFIIVLWLSGWVNLVLGKENCEVGITVIMVISLTNY